MLKNLISLARSRRVVVLLGAGILFAAKWKFVGKPDPAEWSTFLLLVASWLNSESARRHEGNLATSRRFILGALSQVVPALLALAGVTIPAEALGAANGLVASWLLGEGNRRHADSEPEPEPPTDGE